MALIGLWGFGVLWRVGVVALFKQNDRRKKAGYSPAWFKQVGLSFHPSDDDKPAKIAGKLPSHFEGFECVDFLACFNCVFDCHGVGFPIGW